MELKDILISNDYSIYASNGYYSKDNGIKPVLFRLNENKSFFKGLEVVDKIIGKASAMLLVLSGVKKVHALVLSATGKDIFEKYNIEYSYDELVPYIINRSGDGMCPMEITVKDIDNLQEAFVALNNKVKELSNDK